MGAYAEAEPRYRRALAIREKALGSEHPDVAQTLNNLAGLYYTMGAYTEADPRYRRALAIREKALGSEHPDVAQTLNNLAELYRAMGAYAEAERRYRRALTIQEKTLGPEHPDAAQTLNNLAALYQVLGTYAEAGPRYRRALAIQEKALGAKHPGVAGTLNNLGHLAAATGDIAAAAAHMRRAVDIHAKTLPPHHPDRAGSAQALGVYLLRLGRPEEARPLLEEAERAAHTHFQATADLADTDADLFALHQRQRFHFATAVGAYGAEDGLGAALRWQGGALTAEMLWRDLREVEHAERQQVGDARRVEAFRTAGARHLVLLRATPSGPEQKAAYEARLAEARAAVEKAEADLLADHPRLADRRRLPDTRPADICRALHARGGAPLLDYVQHQLVDPQAKGIKFVPHLLAFVVEPVAAKGGEPTCRYHRVDIGPSKAIADAYRAWRGAINGAEACFAKHGRPEKCDTDFAKLDEHGATLRRLAWDPVVGPDGMPWLAEQPRILVVPDGPLAGVPLGALPAAGEGYLVQRHAFTTLSFPAAVALLGPEGDEFAAHRSEHGALVVGAVNYDTMLDTQRAIGNVQRCGGPERDHCHDLSPDERAALGEQREAARQQVDAARVIDPLAGAQCGPETANWGWLDPDRRSLDRFEALADDLGAMLGAATTLATGTAATEEIVRTLLPKRSVVHIETHGYAITVEDEPGVVCMNRHAQAALRTQHEPKKEADERIVGDPQRMSGLVFAGRNPHAARQKKAIDDSLVPLQQKLAALQAEVKSGLTLTKLPDFFREIWRVDDDPQRDNDGLLRARDVLALDLSDTLLVVLAACQTGLGLQSDGEGALGLGRAFLVAGARYAVVSQWQVPANASALMFTDFYRRVAEGTPPPIALQQAQVAVIERLDKRGVKHSAFVWGAFTPLVGYGGADMHGRTK